MTKPTPSQEKILSAAAKHPNCDIRDFMTHIKIRSVSEKVFQTLLQNGWIAEDEDSAFLITAAGREAVGAPSVDAPKPKPAAPEAARPKSSKQQAMIDLLTREEGATLNQLVTATGWQKHSVHGAMAGVLKKKMGLTITSSKAESGGRVYRIA